VDGTLAAVLGSRHFHAHELRLAARPVRASFYFNFGEWWFHGAAVELYEHKLDSKQHYYADSSASQNKHVQPELDVQVQRRHLHHFDVEFGA
jgi:hypothetical protein